MSLNASLKFINTNEALEAAVLELHRRKPSKIGVDCETAFWKLGKDYERLALVQIAYEEYGKAKVFMIDAMARLNYALLRPLLEDESVMKVAHNASFDYSKISYHLKIDMRTVWCTLRAERRGTGNKKGNSLEALCKRYFKLELDKAGQSYDWSIRPLPQKMLVYAAADSVLCLRLQAAQEAKGFNGGYNHVLTEQPSLLDAIDAAATLPKASLDLERLHDWLKEFIAEERHRTEMKLCESFFLDSLPPYFVWDLESFAPMLEKRIHDKRAGVRPKSKAEDPAEYIDSCGTDAAVSAESALDAMYRRFELKEIPALSRRFEEQQRKERESLRTIIKEADLEQIIKEAEADAR